ncbi:MAG: hypothetical protein CL587_08935 [Alteromonadaceae bacterium]|nr:hypothetical protein [Alteromonadaceae bacterium]
MNQPNYKSASIGAMLFVALLIGLVPQGLTEAAITASLPEMSKDLGVNGDLAAQMMIGMSALGLTLGALISGKVLEIFGARNSFIYSILVFGFSGIGGMFLSEPWLLFASRVVVGVASSCIATTCLWGISTTFSGNKRAKVFGIAGAIGGIAVLLSIVTGGFLTQHYGWRMAFVIYPTFALVALVFGVAGLEHRRPEVSHASKVNYFPTLWKLYITVVAFYALAGMAAMQLPFLLKDNGAGEAGLRSLIQALPGLAAILGAGSYGLFHSKIGANWTFSLCMGSLTSGLFILAISYSGLVAPGIGAIAVGLAMGISGPYFYNQISANTSASAGRYIGYLNAFTFFGVFLNPMIAEPVKAKVGVHSMFILGATIALLICLIASRKAYTSKAPEVTV